MLHAIAVRAANLLDRLANTTQKSTKEIKEMQMNHLETSYNVTIAKWKYFSKS